VQELLKVAQSKLSYLKIVTPRGVDDPVDAAAAASRYIVRDGRVMAADGSDLSPEERARFKNWGPGNLDPEDVRRHEASMRRFSFMDRPGGYKPRGPLS
jgi:hypothetical protein